jgi:hypothetical protein
MVMIQFHKHVLDTYVNLVARSLHDSLPTPSMGWNLTWMIHTIPNLIRADIELLAAALTDLEPLPLLCFAVPNRRVIDAMPIVSRNHSFGRCTKAQVGLVMKERF